MPVPFVRVEVGFDSAPDDPNQQWTDISADVRLADGIRMSRGRADEFDNVEPGRLSLTLDNTSGDYTYGNASGANYPNVLPGKRIRVSTSVDAGMSWLPRWDGYVDGWPAEWANGVTQQPRVRITATDRLSRFGLRRVLRDALHEELGTAAEDQSAGWILGDATYSVLGDTATLAGGVVWLYGLQEQSGASSFGDVSGATGRPRLSTVQVGSEGTIEPGTAGIMPEGTAVKFAPASANNGLLLYAADSQGYVGGEFSIWAQFAWSGSTSVAITQVGTAPDPRIILAATPSTVTATIYGTTTVTVTKTITTNDNAPHFALLSVSGSTASLYVDEETAATNTMPAGVSGVARGMYVGSVSSADEVQVAWVGFANAATTATRAGELGMLGSGGSELSDDRATRVLRWLGLLWDQHYYRESGLSQIAYQATGGRQALDIMHELNEVENGVFWVSGSGKLHQTPRAYRYNRSADLTVDAADVTPDLSVAVDASRLVNDLTASRPRGATYRVRDADSIATYSERSESATFYAASDDDLLAVAQWRVNRLAHPAPRIPSLGIDLLTMDASLVDAARALDISRRIEVTGLPSTTTPGGATVDLYVEGVEETISATEWRMSLATSPAWGYVWQLDDATYSDLGSTAVLAY